MNWLRQQIAQPSTARGAGILGALALIFPELDGPMQQVAGGIVGLIGIYDIIRKGRTWREPGA